MPLPRLHLVGHAHIDPAWLWRWPEGLSEVLATFRSALDRIAEHPSFIFSCGSAAFYEFVERADPAMFAEIVTEVGRGRWEILGGFWVEPDTNISSGEALVRHAQLSQAYFRSRFGIVPTVAFNPDAFGHCAGLPQILARSGFHAYVFMRPEPGEALLPRAFRWSSADGSRVHAYRIPVAYCTWPDTLDSHLVAVGAALDGDTAVDGMCFYGVGNHGGGPTRANLAALDTRIAAGDPLVYSSPHRYLTGPGPTVPIQGELGYHARGGYSANSAIKSGIRRTDAALVGAEWAATLATALLGVRYPRAELDRAWKTLLCAGFHDIAAGTVIDSAARDALGSLAAAASAAQRIADDAYVTLAWHTALRAAAEETVLVVFNPHPWATRAPVEAEIGLGPGPVQLSDSAGRAVPVQDIKSEAVAGGRRRITFLASMPAGGWSVYRVAPGSADSGNGPARGAPFEWHLDTDGRTGGIARLAFGDREVLSAPSAYATVAVDTSDTWSHGVCSFGPPTSAFACVSTEILEDGPVRRVVRTISRHGASEIVQKFFVYAGWERVAVDVTCSWSERHAVAKLRFATGGGATVMTESPYSAVERPADGHEYPGGSWVTAAGAGRGFAIANDAKFAYDVLPASLGITVARSPVAAHHEPEVVDAEGECSWLDQGAHRFTWWVGADPDPRAAARLSAELLRPPAVVVGSDHPAAPLSAGTETVVVTNAVLGALKRAEDDRGTIVRVHNPALQRANALVEFHGRCVHRTLEATEIATFHFPDHPSEPARETGLLEEAGARPDPVADTSA